MVYTDGSKTTDGVSFAIVGRRLGHADNIQGTKIQCDASIFTAELLAIKSAVEKGETAPENKTIIVTDSKSSVQAIQKVYSRNPIVQEIKGKAHNSPKKFQLCWVPSHVGIAGNEAADRAAREALRNATTTDVPTLRSDLKAKIKNKSKQEWLSRWKNHTYPRLNYLRAITDDLTPLSNTTCENRSWERILTRLRLGYSRLTHGYLMSREQRPICDQCNGGIQLTIKHILVDCPRYRSARQRAFNRTTVNLKGILIEGNTSVAGPLYKFIKDVNLDQEL